MRAGNVWAPFFLASDRVGAPDEHRRKRVAAWSAAAEAVATNWGVQGLPQLLLVCAGERELSVWERSLTAAAERPPERRVDVLLTTAHAVANFGPAAEVWREPGSALLSPLVELLRWGSEPALQRLCLPHDAARAELLRTNATLREWAAHAAVDAATPIAERAAALAMTTDRDQKRLLEWIARHPLLSIAELAVLVASPEAAVERGLDWLVRCGAVRPDAAEATVARLVLTEFGLRLLATRDAVPLTRYGRFAGITAPNARADRGGANDSIRHREHLLGVNRVFARLALDAQRAGGRLAVRRNEAESTRRFVHDGGSAWIRPDGSGLLELGGGRVPFLLEYDRGTLDGGDFVGKFEGYRRYFAAHAWRQDFDVPPALLFACCDDRAERRVARAARAHAPHLPLLLTSEWRYELDAGNPAGLLGGIWRSLASGEESVARMRLPSRATQGVGPTEGRGNA